MDRTAWSDERLDDAFRELREEMRTMRSEMHAGLLSLQRQIAMLGWGVAATLTTALAALATAAW